METANTPDSDFHSLFSIPLSSLFNFQRNSQAPPPPPPPQPQPLPILPVNRIDASSVFHDRRPAQQHQQSFNGGAPATGPFNYFTSQSSADSAHFSGNEEDSGTSPQIKRDVSTPINLMEFGFEPSEMEIDSEMSFPAGMLMNSRLNHSEVEKMRRDRMNASVSAMASLVPACRSASRKLDKLTVMRLTAQHIKLLRARSSSMMQMPADQFSGEELKLLLSNRTASSLHGFLLVVECDRARILGAANCGNSGLHGAVGISSSDLIGQCLLDLVHPRDVDLVRQQLTAPDLPPTSADDHRPCGWGLRRRFFCRFRHSGTVGIGAASAGVGGSKKKADCGRQYVYLSCSGRIHVSDDEPTAFSPGGTDPTAVTEDSQSAISAAAAAGPTHDRHQQASSCLLLVCRPARPLSSSILPATARCSRDCQFTGRLSLDACFTWVDQRVASILGHLPQDLVGSRLYDLVSGGDVNRLSVAHRSALKGTRSRVSCRLQCAWQAPACSEAVCQLSLLCFINPCTGRPELLSLTCDLQVPQLQQQEQQHQQKAPPVSFPSAPVFDAQTDSSAAPASLSSSAQLGRKIAAETVQHFSDHVDHPERTSASSAVDSGWLALGQLVSSSSSSLNDSHSFEASSTFLDNSMDTTRMCLLGADGGLGDEPDYASMLWPL